MAWTWRRSWSRACGSGSSLWALLERLMATPTPRFEPTAQVQERPRPPVIPRGGTAMRGAIFAAVRLDGDRPGGDASGLTYRGGPRSGAVLGIALPFPLDRPAQPLQA